MRTLIAIAAVLALATGAQAYCAPVPNTADSYVENNLKRTLCLQGELAQSTNALTNKALVNLQLQQLQRDRLQQKMQLQRLRTLGLPNYLLPKY